MTKDEHYRKAEEHLDFANQAEADVHGWLDDRTRYHLTVAQIHATLASAAVPDMVRVTSEGRVI